MKKIVLLLISFISSFLLNAQDFQNKQEFGSTRTLTYVYGGLKTGKGLINTVYQDTASANLSPIKYHPGAQIFINDTLWLRNITATSWIKLGYSPGGFSGNGIMSLGLGWGLKNTNDSTYSIDTFYVQSKYQSEKTRDSIISLISTKADSSNVWRKNGNGGTDTTNFFGTTDVKPIIFKVNNLQAGFITARPDPTSAGSGSVTLGQYAGQKLRWNNGANTLIGHGAGANIIFNPLKANQNTFIGLWAGYWTKYHSDPFGGRSVMVGQSAGFKNYNGSSLTLIGTFAGEANNTGSSITALGRDANRSNIDGNYNTSIGWSANLNNTTGVKTIAVTNGGSGYTTATVTISNPPGPTPGVLWETATATATISGGAITGITVTNPGAGYSLNYGEKDFHDTIRVTITGDGTGASASVTETISNIANTSLGYGAGYLDRFGKYNISIGYLSTMNNQLGEDMILIGSNVTTGALSTTPIINGIAFGKNARVSRSNTMALGGMGADARKVGINTDTARAKLDVVGGDILVHEHTIGRGPGSVSTNTVFGTRVMANNTTALGNVAIGYEVAATGTVSTANVMIGYRAANTANYAGTGNIIVGYEAAYLNRANESVAIGLRSMYNQGSNGSVAIGAYSLYNNVRNTSSGRAMNTAIGDYSYYSYTGAFSNQANTGLGGYSGYGITTGAYNTSIGALSMGKGWSGIGTAGSSGSFNTSLGFASLYYQNNSSGNIGIGSGAFNGATFNPSIGYNIGIGFNAGNAMGIGDYNVLIGGYSGSSHSNVSRHIIFSDGEGSIRFTSDSVGNTSFYGTGGHKFQSGTTAQRPTNVAGTMRWNTDSSAFEYGDGSSWFKFGSGSSSGSSMVYPGAGIAVSTGSAWGASITDNSTNWNTVTNKVNILDTASMLTPYTRVQRFLDSLSNHTTRFNLVTGYLASKVDTGRTLTINGVTQSLGANRTWTLGTGNYGNIPVNRNGILTPPLSDSLDFDAGLSIKGQLSATNFFWAGNSLYPYLALGGNDPLVYFGGTGAAWPSIGRSGGILSLSGSNTQKRVNINSYLSGPNMVSFYDNGTSRSATFLKTTIYFDTIVGGASNGSLMGNAYIGDSTSLGTGNSGHMLRLIAGQGYNAASLNTVYSTVKMGNINSGATQGHGVSFQHDFIKTGSNTLDIMYGAAFLMDSVIAGTVNKRYGLRYWDAWVNGSARLGHQSALKFDKLKAAVGLNAHILADSSQYAQLDGNMLLGDSTNGSGARKAFLWFNGTAPTSSISGAIVWAEGGELKARDASGNVTTLTDAGGSGGEVDGGSFNTTTNTLTITQTVGSDVQIRIPPSYLLNPIHIDSLITERDDSTAIVKAVSVESDHPDISVTTIRNDSVNRHVISKVYVEEPIATFSAGAGFAIDTTMFTDSTIYGSFFTGQDSFYITRAVAVIKGQSGDTLGIQIIYNDTINLTGTVINGGTMAINSRTSGNIIDVSTNQGVPPGTWIWMKSPTVIAGKRPEYLSVTLIGYRKYQAP